MMAIATEWEVSIFFYSETLSGVNISACNELGYGVAEPGSSRELLD